MWPARSAGLARTGGGAAEVAVNPQGLAPRNEGLDGHRTAPHTSPDRRSATPGRPGVVRRSWPTGPDGAARPTGGSTIVIGAATPPASGSSASSAHLFGPCLFGVGLFVVGLAFGSECESSRGPVVGFPAVIGEQAVPGEDAVACRVVRLDLRGAAGDRPGRLRQARCPAGGVSGEGLERPVGVEAQHRGGELGGVVAGVVDVGVQGEHHQFARRGSAAAAGEQFGACRQSGQPGAPLDVRVVVAVLLGPRRAC